VKLLNLVMINSYGAELDRVAFHAKDEEDCAREVLAVMTREKWVLSVGDRVAIQDPAAPYDVQDLGDCSGSIPGRF
jgi:hypothetical protein